MPRRLSYLADRFGALEVEQTAYPALTYIFRHVTLAGSTGDNVAGHRQVELPKFLLEGHLCHQFVNKHAHLRIFAGGILMPAARQHNRYCQTGKRYNETNATTKKDFFISKYLNQLYSISSTCSPC